MFNTFTYNLVPFNSLAGISGVLVRPTDPITLGQIDNAIFLRPGGADTSISLGTNDDVNTIQL